jgi:hypothetical protein
VLDLASVSIDGRQCAEHDGSEEEGKQGIGANKRTANSSAAAPPSAHRRRDFRRRERRRLAPALAAAVVRRPALTKGNIRVNPRRF